MVSKIDIRNKIELLKDKYSKSYDKELLNEVAIYKGLYLALDGKRAVTLPNKYDKLVVISKIIFKYKIKLENVSRAFSYIYNNLISNGIMPEFYFSEPLTKNEDIAILFINIITDLDNNDLEICPVRTFELINSILNEL